MCKHVSWRDEENNFRTVETNKQDDESESFRKQKEADESKDTPRRGRHKNIIKNQIKDKIEKNESSNEDSTEVEANLLEITEPKNIEEALSSPQSLSGNRLLQTNLKVYRREKSSLLRRYPRTGIYKLLNLRKTQMETR